MNPTSDEDAGGHVRPRDGKSGLVGGSIALLLIAPRIEYSRSDDAKQCVRVLHPVIRTKEFISVPCLRDFGARDCVWLDVVADAKARHLGAPHDPPSPPAPGPGGERMTRPFAGAPKLG
jgi:hypothetical protein